MDGETWFIGHKFWGSLSFWGVEHHLTTAYTFHSGLRAIEAIMSVKRFVEDSTGQGG